MILVYKIVTGVSLGVAALAISVIFWVGGWPAPFYVSLLLPIVYPIVLTKTSFRESRTAAIYLPLVFLAGAADLALILGSVDNYYAGLALGWPPTYFWIAVWLGWQLLMLAGPFIKPRQDRLASSN